MKLKVHLNFTKHSDGFYRAGDGLTRIFLDQCVTPPVIGPLSPKDLDKIEAACNKADFIINRHGKED